MKGTPKTELAWGPNGWEPRPKVGGPPVKKPAEGTPEHAAYLKRKGFLAGDAKATKIRRGFRDATKQSYGKLSELITEGEQKEVDKIRGAVKSGKDSLRRRFDLAGRIARTKSRTDKSPIVGYARRYFGALGEQAKRIIQNDRNVFRNAIKGAAKIKFKVGLEKGPDGKWKRSDQPIEPRKKRDTSWWATNSRASEAAKTKEGREKAAQTKWKLQDEHERMVAEAKGRPHIPKPKPETTPKANKFAAMTTGQGPKISFDDGHVKFLFDREKSKNPNDSSRGHARVTLLLPAVAYALYKKRLQGLKRGGNESQYNLEKALGLAVAGGAAGYGAVKTAASLYEHYRAVKDSL